MSLGASAISKVHGPGHNHQRYPFRPIGRAVFPIDVSLEKASPQAANSPGCQIASETLLVQASRTKRLRGIWLQEVTVKLHVKNILAKMNVKTDAGGPHGPKEGFE